MQVKPMTNICKQFGKKVRTIRLERGLSQGDVGKILKVHRTYISGIERGVRNPSLKVIEKISKTLGVTTKELFD